MRNKAIDVLRALAVLLVLGRHANFPENPIAEIWKRGGWVGVDLFFVLSGFLVSGLLFTEFKRAGTITWSRFVIRRGFKIYPAFWFLLLFTLSFNHVTGAAPFEWRRTLSELFFVQNYGWPMWGHTWSLAVEEHFYLMLPVLLAASARDHFRGLPWVVLVVAACLLALRCLGGDYSVQRSLFATHLRLDSLLFGTLLAYLYHFQPGLFARVAAYRRTLAVVGIALLVPPFIWPLEETRLIYTVGFTAFYVGSGAILIAAIDGFPDCWPVRRLAEIGVFSYSIYLIHAAVVSWLFPQATWTQCALYMIASVAIGITLSKLIEMPALRLRETCFPAHSLPTARVSLAKPSSALSPQ
jgi:peptidoglycan/LPS O-acetylase OafA/YrhL